MSDERSRDNFPASDSSSTFVKKAPVPFPVTKPNRILRISLIYLQNNHSSSAILTTFNPDFNY